MRCRFIWGWPGLWAMAAALLRPSSAVVASINNAGPGLNQVGPATNYAILTDFQTWICSFTMLLGRLEVLSLAVIFTPQFWRK